MADSSKPFSFGSGGLGGASSTATATPSLFGTSGSAGGFAGFGSSVANNNTSTGNTPFAGFGASKPQDTSNAAAPATAAFSWGGAAPASGAGTPSNSATARPSLFAPTTPAVPKTTPFSFSTTPAGEPPKDSGGLGASTGASGLHFEPVTYPPNYRPTFGQDPSTLQLPAPKPAPKQDFVPPTAPTTSSNNMFGGPGQDKGSGYKPFSYLSDATSDAPPTAPATTPKPIFGSSQPTNRPTFGVTQPTTLPTFGGTQPTTLPTFGSSQQPKTTSGAPSLFAPSTGAAPAAGQDLSKPVFAYPSASLSEKQAPKPAAAPFSGFNLGGNAQSTLASTSASNATATTAPSLFSFPSTSTPASQPTTSAPTASPFPSFATPNPSTASSQPATTAPAPAPTFPSFNLGGASTSAAQPATTAPAFPSFSVGGASTSAAQPTTTASATSNSTAAPLQPPASGVTASTAGPAPPSQSRLKNKTMDEILTRWATDLTKYTKEFRTTAETVATWDQHLVDNMGKISKLYSQTLVAERQTESVEMQLSAVENQQADLDAWLNLYEKQVDEMLEREGKGQGEVGGPDSEREKTYRLSEKLGERLEEMGADLESMVGEINTANSALSRNGKQDEPITQIVRILNSHLTQLKAIDDGAAALNAKVEKAQKSLGNLAYSNGGMNGTGAAAVDDFYKSYLGRRG